MKKINTGIIITAILVKMYITISRIWAISYMIIKTVKAVVAPKPITVAKPAATEAA